MGQSLKTKNICVIGNGVAANFIIFWLEKLLKMHESAIWQVTQIYQDQLFPPCSMASTATSSVLGMQPGVGHIGDLLLKHRPSLVQFINDYKPMGVHHGQHIAINQPANPQFFQRFSDFKKTSLLGSIKFNTEIDFSIGNSLFFNPREFLSWLKNAEKDSIILNKIVDTVVDVISQEKVLVKLNKHYDCYFDQVFIANGAYSSLDVNDGDGLPKIKPVFGGFWQWDNIDFACESLFLQSGVGNLIYRKDEKILQIGATTQDAGLGFFADLGQLYSQYEFYQKLLVNLHLPDWKNAELVTGVRGKGKKRYPQYGKSSTMRNCYYLNGLYKNAWTLSCGLAKDIVNQALKDN